jgi:hypothetical protein
VKTSQDSRRPTACGGWSSKTNMLDSGTDTIKFDFALYPAVVHGVTFARRASHRNEEDSDPSRFPIVHDLEGGRLRFQNFRRAAWMSAHLFVAPLNCAPFPPRLFCFAFKRFDAATMASRTRSPLSSVDPAEGSGDASAGRPDDNDIVDYDGYDYEDYTNNNSHGNGWASTSSQSSSATSLLAPPSVVTSASLPAYQPETSANSEYVPRRHRSVSATPSRRPIIGPIASASDGSDTDTDSHLSPPVSPGGRSSKEGSNNNSSSNPFEEGEDEEEEDDDDIEEPASPVNPFDSFRVVPKNSHSHPQQANPFDSETVSSATSSKHSKGTGSSRSSSKSSRSNSSRSHSSHSSSSHSSRSKAEEIFEEEPTGYPFVRGNGVHTMMRGALIQGLAPPSTDVENPPAAVSDNEEEDEEDGSDDGERTRDDDDGAQEDSYGVAYESERIGSVGESIEVRGGGGGGTGVAYYSASTTQGSGTEDDNNRTSPRYSATTSRSGSTNRNTPTSSSGTSGASQSLDKASREPPDSDYASVGPSSIWGSSFNTRRSIPIPLRHHGSVTTSDRYDGDTSSRDDNTSVLARFASFKRRSGRKSWCMILLVLTTLLLVGAVVAVSILMFGNKGPTQQEQIDAVIVTVSDPDALKDERTPQYKARQWILYEDPQWDDLSNLEASGVTQQHIIQRYALAVLYYATNGPTGWGANHGWLLGGECDEPAWFGLACDPQGEVRAIGFGTCAFAETFAVSIDSF